MQERRCENGVGNGAHRSVFVIVVPHGERRFPATSDYGINGDSRAHEDTVSDTAPYTSDLFPVRRGRRIGEMDFLPYLPCLWSNSHQILSRHTY